MSHKRMNAIMLSVALIHSTFFISACSKTTETARSNEPAPRVESAAAPPTGILALVSPTPTPSPNKGTGEPPNPTDIRNAVARVFEKAATPDASRQPGFAVGDFNGDGSEDLAVIVSAGENSLPEINNELANWLLEDPRTVPLPTAPPPAQPPRPVRAQKGDALLAIIHGVGPQGWRSPDARQTFLLKNGAGSNMVVQSLDDLRKARRKLPALRGDIINETIAGKTGVVFWTGARYGWYSLPVN